jgi:hypothetical protein
MTLAIYFLVTWAASLASGAQANFHDLGSLLQFEWLG